MRFHTKQNIYIGLMSGTSADGVDGVVAEITPYKLTILASQSIPFESSLRNKISSLFTPGQNEIDKLGALDKELATLYVQCVHRLLKLAKLDAHSVTAIGNHGQTIRHRPNGQFPFSLQIGDSSYLANNTSIPVVSDFRRADIALGGQGAPLVPAFHHAMFASNQDSRCIINIGGIANITHLPLSGHIEGWDTGPGNGLMDAWIQKNCNLPFDKDGIWAASGNINLPLLNKLLDHPYFHTLPPKSTGKEEFYLERMISENTSVLPQDVQATLLELTAITIASAINTQQPKAAYLCGGGALNLTLKKRIAFHARQTEILDTQAIGLAPTWVEAAAFAWLAHQYWQRLPSNLPAVTGASRTAILGCLTLPA